MNTLLTLWRRLTAPHPSIQAPAPHENARLTIATLLFLAPLSTVAVLILAVLDYRLGIFDAVFVLAEFATVLSLWLLYGLSRSQYGNFAAPLMVIFVLGAALVLTVMKPEFEVTMAFLPFALLLAGLLLDVRATFVILLVTLASTLGLALLGSVWTVDDLVGIITVEFFFGLVVLLSTVLKERAARKIEQQTRELERRSDSAEIRVAYAEERGHALSETLFALAALELKERAPVTSNGDVFDALAVSMNMVAEELDARVGELERHSTLIAGIAQIGTRLSLETNPQDIFARLAEELEAIEIRLALATWNADRETLDFIYYSNPAPAIADSILKGFGLDRHRVPPTIFPPFAECAQERKIVFVPDILGLVTTHFKNFPTWLLERSLKFTRSERGVAAFVLPLLAEERLIGILELWSGNLREDDAATLQLMASQLSAALYRAEQHARLQEHADALAAANERLAHLLQTLPIIIYTSKAEGDYEVTYISETLRQIAGYTPEHFLSSGTFWRDHLYPNDAARVLGELARLPESKFLQIDYRWQVADGSYRWFSDSMRLVADKDGKSNHIVGVWQDISERKDAERQLQASEERFRDLFESAPDGIILSDTEGRIRLVNRAMASMLGYTPEELSNLDLAMTYPEVDRPELKERLRALAQHGSLRFERAMLRKDGTIFPVDATVNRTSNGMYQGILRDITARRQADQQLRRALDEAESASRAKSQFLSVLSHELFTPLNVILGFAQLLELDADKLGARGQRGIEQINLAGRRMQAMISDLLDYARLDMGRLDLAVQAVQTSSLLDVACAKFGPLATEKQIRRACENFAPANIVRADPRRLGKALDISPGQCHQVHAERRSRTSDVSSAAGAAPAKWQPANAQRG